MQSPTIAEIPPLDLSRFFDVHPTLETERLHLREITLRDQNDIFEYASDPETTTYMVFPTSTAIEETIAFIESSAKDFEAKKRMLFGIELKRTAKLIGACGFHDFSASHHNVQFGYILNRGYWGKGYMTEAVKELMRFAFEEMGIHRLEAHCDQENERSARVLERCGMSLEGVFKDYELRKGRFITTKVYGLLASDR